MERRGLKNYDDPRARRMAIPWCLTLNGWSMLHLILCVGGAGSEPVRRQHTGVDETKQFRKENVMAWKYPKHVCGHEGPRYQSYGPYERRNRRHATIESRPCPDCLAKAAGAKAKESGLPVLKGSPKQIAWAADIRENLLKFWEKQLVTAEALLEDVADKDKAKARAVVEGAIRRSDEYRAHIEARWWIENRETRSPLDQEVHELMLAKTKIGIAANQERRLPCLRSSTNNCDSGPTR